jgi:hypothetical protein
MLRMVRAEALSLRPRRYKPVIYLMNIKPPPPEGVKTLVETGT